MTCSSYREKKISDQRAAELRTISELRFAKQFSPEAFDNYINENRKGILTIARLPAENDSILMRVRKIRERDYLYIDRMQDYYDGFSQQMHLAYQDFRRASYDSVVRARQLNQQGNKTDYQWYWRHSGGYLWTLPGAHWHCR